MLIAGVKVLVHAHADPDHVHAALGEEFRVVLQRLLAVAEGAVHDQVVDRGAGGRDHAAPQLRDRVLFVTGNLGDPAVLDIVEAEPARVVGKPFTRDEYVARVRFALDGWRVPDAS